MVFGKINKAEDKNNRKSKKLAEKKIKEIGGIKKWK
jgi:hypothetical protein